MLLLPLKTDTAVAFSPFASWYVALLPINQDLSRHAHEHSQLLFQRAQVLVVAAQCSVWHIRNYATCPAGTGQAKNSMIALHPRFGRTYFL